MEQVELYPKEPPEDVLMRKHVNAVALMPVKGGRKISLLDRRLYNLLLHFAQKQGQQDEYHARLHEILKYSEYNSNNTKPLKQSLVNLMRTTVEWQSPTDGEIETWDACQLLSGGGITKVKSTGAVIVRWRYDPLVRSQLLNPERYAGWLVPVMMQLSTHPALALYEICSRYIDNPGRKTSRRHWRWWRPVLTGAPDDGAKGEYRYFKRDVLAPAIAEINANTDIEITGPIEYKERDNKTIAEIQFEVRLKKGRGQLPMPKPLEKITEAHLPLIGLAIKNGVSQTEAEAILLEHGPQAFSDGILQLAKRLQMPADRVGEVRKAGSWLRAHLKNQAKKEAVAPASNTGTTIPSLAPTMQMSDMKKKRAAWTDVWLNRRKEELLSLFKESTEAEQVATLEDFGRDLEATKKETISARFKLSGWSHRMVRETFVRFLGAKTYGQDWDKPSAEDLLAIAAMSDLAG